MKFILALVILQNFFTQDPIQIEDSVSWYSEELNFENAVFDDSYPGLPIRFHRFPVFKNRKISAQLKVLEKEEYLYLLPEWIALEDSITLNNSAGNIAFVPIYQEQGKVFLIKKYLLNVSENEEIISVQPRTSSYKNTSTLSTGSIYKMAIPETGIYKLTYGYLRDSLKISVDQLNPGQLSLHANRGGLISHRKSDFRQDDLTALPYWSSGLEDGKFDPTDFICVYAEGPGKLKYDGRISHETNIYSSFNYLFLKIGGGQGLTVSTENSVQGPVFTENTFDDYLVAEEDKRNLLHEWSRLQQGSGQRWYNEVFRGARSYTFNNLFSIPNLVQGSSATVDVAMALRARVVSNFRVTIQNSTFQSPNASRVSQLSGDRDTEISYAHHVNLRGSFIPTSDNFNVTVEYPFPEGPGDGSEGWLDFIGLQVKRNLIYSGNTFFFRSLESSNFEVTEFVIRGMGGSRMVWEIKADGTTTLKSGNLVGDIFTFSTPTRGAVKDFVVFDPLAPQKTPLALGKIENQNVHGISKADAVILYPKVFENQAIRLRDHRKNHSGMTVDMVEIEALFNEFGGGRRDPAAIRDFVRMVKQRDPRFKYLILFGDGSFDHRDIYKIGNNFVPVYETESFNPILAFPSDDYYGIPESDEADPLGGPLSVLVGRIPVNSTQEAVLAVDKIIRYDQGKQTLGNWRNRMLFVGDDEDNMLHTRDADQIADQIGGRFPEFNIEKVYLDAFPQISTPGEQRYPSVTEAIQQSIFRGILTFTYLGHGGISGLAQERILEIPELLKMRNIDKLPLFITATCSFTAYDAPSIKSAGEVVYLNSQGGAIGLLTTVRAVFAQQNAELTSKAMRALFERDNGKIRTLGDAMLIAKNDFVAGSIVTNSRKFALIGDPSQRMAIPEYQIQTTSINSESPNPSAPDTLKALQKVTISGYIADFSGKPLENFQGEIFPVVYDKEIELRTLGQDERSYPYVYNVQNNILFRGRASVKSGLFQFTFVVPKDINFNIGRGKLSYYASDFQNFRDAGGVFRDFLIGGSDAASLNDVKGPEIGIFFNSENFVFGGITGPDPVLLVKLKDENGINVAGNSIGHDLEGFLDENLRKPILLNDFYEAKLDDYTSGEVRFPLFELEEGKHSMRVKAWDVANNSSEEYSEFVVAENEIVALRNIFNYPNPFTTSTCFQFDHNQAGKTISVEIKIYTISGRLVKTLNKEMISDGAIRLDNCIPWDGLDEYGDKLGKGIYLYRVGVETEGLGDNLLKGESDFKKLVIIK